MPWKIPWATVNKIAVSLIICFIFTKTISYHYPPYEKILPNIFYLIIQFILFISTYTAILVITKEIKLDKRVKK
jgi:hypothetical protein